MIGESILTRCKKKERIFSPSIEVELTIQIGFKAYWCEKRSVAMINDDQPKPGCVQTRTAWRLFAVCSRWMLRSNGRKNIAKKSNLKMKKKKQFNVIYYWTRNRSLDQQHKSSSNSSSKNRAWKNINKPHANTRELPTNQPTTIHGIHQSNQRGKKESIIISDRSYTRRTTTPMLSQCECGKLANQASKQVTTRRLVRTSKWQYWKANWNRNQVTLPWRLMEIELRSIVFFFEWYIEEGFWKA